MARKSFKKRKFRKGKTKKRSTRKSFAKRVNAIVNKGRETKEIYTFANSSVRNSQITTTNDNFFLIGGVSQGVGEGQRIGEEIEAKSITVKGCIVYNPSVGQFGTYANTRLMCRVMIVQPKMYKDYSSIQANSTTWMPTLLSKGPVSVGFTGLLDDLWSPINTETITCYYDKLIPIQGVYQLTAAGITEMQGSTKFFRKTFKFPGSGKKLKYDQAFNGGTMPTNFCPVLIMGYAHLNGGAPDVSTTAVELSCTSLVKFKDA